MNGYYWINNIWSTDLLSLVYLDNVVAYAFYSNIIYRIIVSWNL